MNFEHAFVFIKRLSALETAREVGAALADSIAPFGYFAVSCGGARETAEGPSWEFFFNTWPADWISVYQKMGYVRYDPVPATARVTPWPFAWREIGDGRQWTPEQREFLIWVREVGIVDAFVVPIHEPDGYIGICVSLSDHLIVDAEERLALQLASFHAYRRCRELGGFTLASSVKAPLTARELECLRWVLKGKSDRDIGAILDISHTTVHFHIEKVKRKLGVTTRTQAAGTLVTLGYL